MTNPVVELPDIEALIISYLVTAMPGVNIYATEPGAADFQAQLPMVVVKRIGGPYRFRKILDAPIVDIDVYADSREHAVDTIATVRAKVEALKNTVTSNGTVTDTDELTGPQERPEFNPAVARQGLTVTLLVRPN